MSTRRTEVAAAIDTVAEKRENVWNVPILDNALLFCIFMAGGILEDRRRRLFLLFCCLFLFLFVFILI